MTATGSYTGLEVSKNKLRRIIQLMVFSFSFEFISLLAIISNSIYIGVEVQYAVYNRTGHPAFYIIGIVYSAFFTVELVLRLIASGWVFFDMSNMHVCYNYLDLLIVASSLLEVIADLLCGEANCSNDAQSGTTDNVRLVRIVRLAKLIRLIRIAKLVAFFGALRLFLYSILTTLKTLAWALVLLFMITYAFGLFFTQRANDFLIDDERHSSMQVQADPRRQHNVEIVKVYWGNLWASLLTLFKAIAGGLSWDIAVTPMELYSGGTFDVLIFLFYITFTVFAVMNVFTGFFCQSAIQTAQENQELVVHQHLANKRLYVRWVQDLFKKIDQDCSGGVTIDELEEHIKDENVQAMLESMDISTADAWTLFKLLDTDDGDEIDLEEFVDGLLRLKGNAKRVDLIELEAYVKKTHGALKKLTQKMEDVVRLGTQPLMGVVHHSNEMNEWY